MPKKAPSKDADALIASIEKVRADKAAVETRIAVAKGKNPKSVRLYVDRLQADPHVHDTVRCRLCGEPVAGLVPHDRFPDRLVFVTFASRQGIRLLFDDGSRHETSVCKNCAPGMTLPDIESIYCADLLEMQREEAITGHAPPWHILAHRTPTGFERIQ